MDRFLSKSLGLKVNQKYFNANQAHTARYDAEFTYQLYVALMKHKTETISPDTQQRKPNPFGSSRVDTPFQDHVDFQEVYHSEFEILKSIIFDIKNDINHQSKGAIVIGEPGSGKTHLMMRLAKELLQTNRLLFIRQPNNANAVLYHIYSRILESFIEKVPGSNSTQLEHLLANSFVKLINSTRVKEIFTHVPNSLIILNLFPDRWEQFKEIFSGAIVDRISQYQVRLSRPSPDKLKQILELKAKAVDLDLEEIFPRCLKNLLSKV